MSVGGGSAPRWSSDSDELFYVSRDGWLMSVSIGRSGDGLVIGKPVALFQSRAFQREPDYDVAGKDRFLLKVPLGEAEELFVGGDRQLGDDDEAAALSRFNG